MVNEKLLLKKTIKIFPSNAAKLLYGGSPISLLPGYLNKKLIFIFFIFCSLFNSTKSSAQFCQTWSLAGSPAQTGNSGAATSGNTELIGTGMSTPAYGTYQSFPKPGGVNWPSVVNTANGIYLEFPVTPTVGNNLEIGRAHV